MTKIHDIEESGAEWQELREVMEENNRQNAREDHRGAGNLSGESCKHRETRERTVGRIILDSIRKHQKN